MTLRLCDVTVTVPDGPQTLTILDHVDLELAHGETAALTGASGSGKSTLLAVAALLRRPDSGRVEVAGTDATDLSRPQRTELRRNSIGIVYQSPNLLPALTALEQLLLVAHIAGRLDRAARARARELLESVGLSRGTDRRPAELSGGERQRVGIARALMPEPAVLLADEPTAALDPERGRQVIDLLVAATRERDISALVVTHTPDQLGTGVHRHHLEDTFTS